jgi:hypothetical protein
MSTRRDYSARSTARQARGRNIAVSSRTYLRQPKQARRSIIGQPATHEPFAPPEDWYEPAQKDGYRIVVQPPGPGYRHVVTPQQIRDRLALLPSRFLVGLDVVQLSRMTRKKQCFPCYGMQWGSSLYLYPLEETLIEQFDQPPGPGLYNEARMYGGRWDEPAGGVWTLRWSKEAAQDFYLNNILIHELGHLVDDRNTSYADRERFAEWFAIEYGYRAGGGGPRRRPRQGVRRRHHAM